MEAYDAIMTRRSVPRVTEQEPDRISIERLLDAGVRAPTHHLTQPWRFIVLRGGAREALGEAWAAGAAAEGRDPESVRAKPLRAPVIIVVIEHPKTERPKVVEAEEHHAVGAAIQNILLAAHAAGMGAQIRTGDAATLTQVREHLGVEDGEHIAGFIYLGYPPEGDEERNMTKRVPASEKTGWRGYD